MSKPDNAKKFPKVVNLGNEVYIALRKYKGSKAPGRHYLPGGIAIEFDKKGRVVGITVRHES